MVVKEIRDYGHCGITVQLNSMDQYALNHLKEYFEDYLHALETAKAEGTPEPEEPEEAIQNCIIFLKKLSLDNKFLPTVFEEDKDEEEC